MKIYTYCLSFFLLPALLFAADDPSGRFKEMGYCFDAAHDPLHSRIYVAAGTEGMHVFDVNDVGKLTFVSTVNDGGYYRNLKISGDRLYVANGEEGLVVYELSSTLPVVLWKEKSNQAMGLHMENGYVYLAQGKKGIALFETPRASEPKKISECDTPGNAWDVAVKEGHAFVADLQKGLTVVDLADPTSPRIVGRATWGRRFLFPNAKAEMIQVEGDYAYIAAWKHGLVILDIQNPKKPRVVSRITSGKGGFGEGLAVRDGLVYLSNGHYSDPEQNGLFVIDARNASAPKLLGRCSFEGWVEDVCLVNNLVVHTNTVVGVRVIDVTDPSTPTVVNTFGPSLDPLLKAPITSDEQSIIDSFHKTKRQIEEGSEFSDQSTPASALLTMISAICREDPDLYGVVNPSHWDYMKEQGSLRRQWKRLSKRYRGLTVKRTAVPPSIPQEGDVSPVYVAYPGDSRISGVEVFGYVDGAWRKLFNTGTGVPDWNPWEPAVQRGLARTRAALAD